MKEVLLKKDIEIYLRQEINRIRVKSPYAMTEIRELSFMQGYKEGQLAAAEKIYRDILYGLSSKL